MADLWDDMLDEFRALGGTADNICLKEGPFGRGLFPRDPSKPIRIHIPENLLVDLKHVCFADNEFRVAPDAPVGFREKAFLENYERDFSWGAGHQYEEGLLQMMSEAPPELRALLEAPFGLNPWLAGPTPGAIQDRFLTARVIHREGVTVVMPIIELANYGNLAEYGGENGVKLSGQFSGEVLVHYEFSDPLEIFRHWGFASDSESFALSLPMALERKSGPLFIGREVGSSAIFKPGRKPYFPDLSIESGKITLSYLMLGHKKYPRLARGIFYRIMRQAGRSDAEETFDLIQHINRMQFYNLAAASEAAAPALGRLLRSVARYQLEAMSHSIGTREV